MPTFPYEVLRSYNLDARFDCLNPTLFMVYGVGSPSAVERLSQPSSALLESASYTGYGLEVALLPLLANAMKRYVDIARSPVFIENDSIVMAKHYFDTPLLLSFRDLRSLTHGYGQEAGEMRLFAGFARLFYRLVLESKKLALNPDFAPAAELAPTWYPDSRQTLFFQRTGVMHPAMALARSMPHEVPRYIEGLLGRAHEIAVSVIQPT